MSARELGQGLCACACVVGLGDEGCGVGLRMCMY